MKSLPLGLLQQSRAAHATVWLLVGVRHASHDDTFEGRSVQLGAVGGHRTLSSFDKEPSYINSRQYVDWFFQHAVNAQVFEDAKVHVPVLFKLKVRLDGRSGCICNFCEWPGCQLCLPAQVYAATTQAEGLSP